MKKLYFEISKKADASTLIDGIIQPSTRKEGWGSLMIATEDQIDWSDPTLRSKRLVVFKSGPIDTLKAQIEKFGIKPGLEVNETLGSDYQVELRESTRPFFANQKPKIAGEGGDVLLFDDSPIYRQTFLVHGEPNHQAIQHNGTMSWKDYEDSVASKQLAEAEKSEQDEL